MATASASRPRRMTSSIISQWPWASGALTQSENLEEIVDPAKDLQDFARALTSCEKRLLSWAGGEREVKSLQSLIGVQVNSSQALAPIQAGHTNNNADQTRLCSVISGYQLLARNPHPDICRNPPYEVPRTGAIPAKLPPGYDKLENWVDMLFDVKKLLGDFRAPVNVSTQRAPERLTTYIRHFQRQGDCAKIIVNMLAAALHLAFLKENKFQHGEIPDIPENVEKMSDDSPYKLPLMSLLEGLSARAKQGSVLRLPLHLALLISPLYLLVPLQLLKNPFGREAVMQLSVCLGNVKGPLLRLVEDEVMATEARLAELDVDPLEELRSLFSRIPWESLRHCDARERFFFRFEPQALIEEAPVQPLPPPPPPTLWSTPAAAIQRGAPPSPLPPPPSSSIRQPTPGVETVGERFRLILRGGNPATPCPASRDDQGSRSSSSSAERQVEPFNGAEEDESDMSLESSDDDEPPERRGTPSGLNGSPEAELNARKQPEQNGLGKSAPPNHPSAEAAASLSAMSEALDESGVNQHDDSPATVGEVVTDQANIPSDDELSSVGDDDSGHSPSEDGPGTRHSGRRGGRVAEFDPLLDEASSDSSSDAEDPGSESSEGQDSGRGLNDKPDGPGTWGKMPESSQGGDPGGEAGGRRSKREPKKIMDLKPVDLAPPKKNPRRGPKGGKKPKPAATERQASIGRDAEHPIDVDAYAALDVITWTEREREALPDLVPLNDDSQVKFEGETHTFYGARGEEFSVKPRLHYDQDVKGVECFLKAVEANYVDGKPKHCARPDESVLEAMEYGVYMRKSCRELMEILRHKMAIVVTGIPTDPSVGVVNFDREGLGTLQQSFKNTISIQDYSIQSGENPNDRLQNGTLEQLLEAAGGPNGKILNALEFPFTEPRIPLQQRFSSDMAAWFATDRPTEKLMVPVKDIRWGLAGLGGSVTHWHVDSDGFCTFVDVLCGLKLWMFGVTPRELASSPSMFLQPAFELSEPNIGRVEGAYDKDAKYGHPAIWDLEAVVLPANTRLIMRPNVAHAVFTPEHSICHGGHFFATSTIQDTAASLIHSFTVGNYITNTWHYPSRLLLRKMMEFYYRGVVLEDVDERYVEHLPDPNSIEGLVDLLTMCNLNILGNVLDYRTYSAPNESSDRPATEAQRLLLLTSDVNNIPPEERAHMRYARGIALEVFRWARCQYETRFNSAIVDLPSLYLEHQCRGIVQYKKMAKKGNYEGAPNCTLIGLTAQVKNVLALVRDVFSFDYDARILWKQHKIPPGIAPDNLLLGDLSRFSCTRKKRPGKIRAMTEFQEVGETELDKRSLRARAGRAGANEAVEERPAKKQRVF